ncbi:hypothetical protein D3C87_1463320 [compost metagenome]
MIIAPEAASIPYSAAAAAPFNIEIFSISSGLKSDSLLIVPSEDALLTLIPSTIIKG